MSQKDTAPSQGMREKKQRGPRFSNYHPLLPKRYVPPWQLDMKNRTLLVQNGKLYGHGDNWKGHISYFLQGRERLSATCHQPYRQILDYTRNLHPNGSHFSRFNSGLMTMKY